MDFVSARFSGIIEVSVINSPSFFWKVTQMAAMKPRTGDGPMECPKEGRGYVLRVPLEGGGRLVVELNAQEVKDLGAVLKDTVAAMPKK